MNRYTMTPDDGHTLPVLNDNDRYLPDWGDMEAGLREFGRSTGFVIHYGFDGKQYHWWIGPEKFVLTEMDASAVGQMMYEDADFDQIYAQLEICHVG